MTSLRGDYGWVSDNAGVVESRDQQTIDETIDGLYKRYGTEIAVVTLQALPTRNSEEYRAFATRLFNAWGVGNAARDTGVLLLLVRDNRRFEVVTGSGLSTVVPSAWLYDFQTRELEAPLVGGDYSKALAKTVVAIAEKIEEHESNWRSNQAKLQAAKKEVVPQEQRSVFTMLGQLGVLLSLFAGYLYWSWREEDKADETHKCFFCGGEVERDTSRILSYTDAQALEVALGAATYEAGKCSGCRRTQNIRRLAFRRGAVQRCDYCRNHTALESESFVVDEKAQKRTRVLRKDCQYQACAKSSFTEEPVAFISSISEDSSSAPSGFGGGSTSGGGSGRSF